MLRFPITRQLRERLLMQKKSRQRTRALMRSQRKAQQRIRRKKLPVQTNLQQQKMRQRHLRILMNFRESISMCMQA